MLVLNFQQSAPIGSQVSVPGCDHVIKRRPHSLLASGNFWFSDMCEAGPFTLAVKIHTDHRAAVLASPHTGATLWKNYQLNPHMHKVVSL